MKVKIRRLERRGRIEWVVDVRSNGTRTRTSHPTRMDAEASAGDILGQWNAAGDSWALLPARERADIVMVAKEIVASGRTLRDVWDWFRRSAQPPSVSVPLVEAIERCVAAKIEQNRRPRYIRSLREHLENFAAGREQIPVASVTAQMVKDWLRSRPLAPATRNGYLSRLSSLMEWARIEGLIPSNPCRDIPQATVDRRPPRILTPDEAGRLLSACEREQPRILAWMSLCLLAGMRPEEADRMRWTDIDLTRGVVQVDAAASKVRFRRVIRIESAAGAWLERARTLRSKLPLGRFARAKCQRELRQSMGWNEWPHDVLRHSAASYLLALHGDAGKVSLFLGNSVDILLTHYHELVSREEAERFWQIRPN